MGHPLYRGPLGSKEIEKSTWFRKRKTESKESPLCGGYARRSPSKESEGNSRDPENP